MSGPPPTGPVARTSQVRASWRQQSPVSLCRDGQEFGSRREDRHEVVLWSTWDLVLTCLFPPGEAAGLDGICLRSVGSSGQPELRWKTPRRPSTGLGHSDYYGDRRAADEVAGQLLRWRVPRALPYQELAERPILHPENSLEGRELASRPPGSPAPTWLPA